MLNFGNKKLMASLGVDETAREQFEQEKKAGCGKFGYGEIVITENWFFHDSLFGRQSLFPLREIAFYEKSYTSLHYGTDFYVRLIFTNGSKYRLRCEFEQQDKIMALLKERCPQASEREWKRFL